MTRSERMLSMTVLGLITGGEPYMEVLQALAKILEEGVASAKAAEAAQDMPRKEEMS